MEAQRKHLENAGLNVALMYGSSGAGGSTSGSGSASVGGGQAANSAQAQQTDSARSCRNGMMKMQSEIELNKSIAEKNRAEAQTTGDRS